MRENEGSSGHYWPRIPIPDDPADLETTFHLCRPLRLEEMTYITEVIRRLKALLLGEKLDANYRDASTNTLTLSGIAGKQL